MPGREDRIEDNTFDTDDATFTDPAVVDDPSYNAEVSKLIDYIQSEASEEMG